MKNLALKSLVSLSEKNSDPRGATLSFENYIITPLSHNDLDDSLAFSDQWIGVNYFTRTELEDYLLMSVKGNTTVSYIARTQESKVVGLRLSLAPGLWVKKTKGLTPEKWGFHPSQVGYFKSLFLHKDHRLKGLGLHLSKLSIDSFKKIPTQAIICHSWKESPGNSSYKYLKKLGFKEIKEHPLYWSHLDYNCVRCKRPPCQCTAIEMLLPLEI